MIGLVAVIGAMVLGGIKIFLNHQERIEKIRSGIDPDNQSLNV